MLRMRRAEIVLDTRCWRIRLLTSARQNRSRQNNFILFYFRVDSRAFHAAPSPRALNLHPDSPAISFLVFSLHKLITLR